MVRIKGANSDYKFDVNTGQIEGPKPTDNPDFEQPLYLKIFICPYDMPSRVEAPLNGQEEDYWCEGTDNQCPHVGDSPGHAVVSLHEKEGISLVTNRGNQLVVDQNNGIRLQPDDKTSIEVKSTHIALQRNNTRIEISTEGNITLSVPPQNRVIVNGALTTNQDLTVEQSLTVKQSLTVGNRLTITGNLTVTGELDLSRATNIKLSKPLIEQIVQSINSQK